MPYGYLMDIMATIQFAVFHSPDLRETVKSSPMHIWHLKVLSALCYYFAEKIDLLDLGICPVWIGNGKVRICWRLPDRLENAIMTKELTRQLLIFQSFIGASKPSYYYTAEKLEPNELKNVSPLKRPDRYCFRDVMIAFDDKMERCILVDKLVAEYALKSGQSPPNEESLLSQRLEQCELADENKDEDEEDEE